MTGHTTRLAGASALAFACGAPPTLDCPAPPTLAATVVMASASVSVSPATTSTAAPLPELRLAWEEDFGGGDVQAAASGSDLLLVPRFMAATVEGSRATRLDPAGISRWERAFPGVGAGDLAASPDGRAIAVVVSALNWPKTAAAYGSSRLVWLDEKGVTTWNAPKGVELESVAAPSEGEVLFSASFNGSVRLSPSITVEADNDGAWFVASLQGDVVRFASVRDAPLRLIAAPAGPPYAIVLRDGPDAPARAIERLGARGAKAWRIELDGACGYRAGAIGPKGNLFITTSALCSAPHWRGDPKAASPDEACRLTELSAEDGRALKSAPVPGCRVLADERGVGVAADDESGALTVTLLDDALVPTRQVFAPAPRCAGSGGGLSDVLFASTSVYVVGACFGQRIGTMFNSPYARATSMSTTYIARYVRP